MLVQVDDEVLLGLELPGQLAGLHHAERALLRFCDLVRVHSICRWIYFILIRRKHALIGSIVPLSRNVRERKIRPNQIQLLR